MGGAGVLKFYGRLRLLMDLDSYKNWQKWFNRWPRREWSAEKQ